MLFLTSDMLKEAEKRAMENVSSMHLIRNAAAVCFEELKKYSSVCVFCGKGNNGSDGYATAILLKKNNVEYKKLLDEKHIIMDKCPNLVDILDNEKQIELSAEESKFVHDYDLVMIDLSVLESKEMFIRGMREAYYLFKKMNIIK